jgi:transcriptional regulatory protein LevR
LSSTTHINDSLPTTRTGAHVVFEARARLERLIALLAEILARHLFAQIHNKSNRNVKQTNHQSKHNQSRESIILTCCSTEQGTAFGSGSVSPTFVVGAVRWRVVRTTHSQ